MHDNALKRVERGGWKVKIKIHVPNDTLYILYFYNGGGLPTSSCMTNFISIDVCISM